MTLIRWNPNRTSRDMVTFEDELNRMFDGLWTSPTLHGFDRVAAPVDVQETDDAYVLHVDLPGYSSKDVKVGLNGDVLTIRGERRREDSTKHGKIYLSERAFGAFERSFTLTKSVQADKVEASYRDGVLEVRVPKAEEARPREIEVRVG